MTTTQDPIAHASRLLRQTAEELRQAHTWSSDRNNWIGEPEAKAAYDEHMAAAQALEDWEAAVGAGGVQPLRSVQEGCKLVPLEPTPEMLAALMSPGEAEVLASSPSETFALMLMDRAGIRERYSAMLAASPTPPAEQQAASSAVLKAIREANMQLVRTGDDAFMLVPYKVATAEQQAAPKAAPQQKAHHLTQALTDHENQPNQYGVEFGMSGQQMHFKIGNQLFRLAYEPDDQQEFEFMKRMLIHAFSTFTPDVKAAPGEQNAVSAEWLEQAYREGWAACRDAETIGEEAEDWAFGNSTANSRMIDAQQAAPQQEAQEPTTIDQKTMELAESVGLIGPASRIGDLHAAIQRFHDLICVNATIKAAVMAADVISGVATPARDYPPLPMQFACSGVFPVYSADQMRAYVDADRAAYAPGSSQPAPAPLCVDVVRDAAFDAVRKKLCALPRFSFLSDGYGVRRVPDKSGSWIAFDAAHALFDPVAVDAALAAQGGK